jgi:hypothetical protein
MFTFDCNHARYSDILASLLDSIGATEVLRLDYESDYSGYVDCDVLLSNGKVFSYKYYYGSCSGCDDWEDRGLSDDEISAEMLKESTTFENRAEYDEWRKRVDSGK